MTQAARLDAMAHVTGLDAAEPLAERHGAEPAGEAEVDLTGVAPGGWPPPRSRPDGAPAPAAREGAPEPGPPEPEANLVELLLRSPGAFVEAAGEGDLVPLLRAMLLTVTLGAGTFGAVVGAHRGGVQVLYAAVKVPLMLLGAMAICAPAFIGLARALGVRLPAREVVTVSLGACARAALVLAGLAPVLWLFEGFMGYHSVALSITGGCALAGAAAAGLLLRGLRRGGGGWAAGLAFLAVFGVVGSQTGWLLRPFLVRPRATHVPFVRGLEGDLLDAVRRSSRSAAGVYDRDEERPADLDDARLDRRAAPGLPDRGSRGEAP